MTNTIYFVINRNGDYLQSAGYCDWTKDIFKAKQYSKRGASTALGHAKKYWEGRKGFQDLNEEPQQVAEYTITLSPTEVYQKL